MKNILNLLFYSDINKFLKDEQVKFLVVHDNNNYIINELPIYYNGYMSALKNYLAYDYDELNFINKEIYKNTYTSLKKIEENNYMKKTKIYKKISN